MSDTERFGGKRELTYSHWHRRASISRFLKNGDRSAFWLSMIDIDANEYCNSCYRPIALIETARDVGQSWKNCGITRKTAELGGLLAYVVLYSADVPDLCISCGNYRQPWPDISGFRVLQVEPESGREFKEMTPQEYALFLVALRVVHWPSCDRSWGKEWALLRAELAGVVAA